MSTTAKEDKSEQLRKMRHSASHIMAEAVQSLFPDTKFGIGPAIENGFYYDFELPRSLTPDDLISIEAKMKEIIKNGVPFTQQDMSKKEARQIFADQPYKLELVDELPDDTVSIYRQGSFTDLCKGPHVASSREVRAFKLTTIAGAYWRGDETRPMLQRIYGVAFLDRKQLKAHLHMIEEAGKRDHRKLGRELDLYSISNAIGPGLALWHPKGALVRRTIEDFWKDEHLKKGYDLLYTPHIAKSDLWKTSGHWEMYRENMFSPMDVEGQEYVLKPMNCPFHIMIYKSTLRSYRELPIRYAELGTVYRFERSGVLYGLTRVRGFTQDDAHIFCRRDQLQSEIEGILELVQYMMSSFGFEKYDIMLSTRPDKYAGTLEAWDEATEILRQALEHLDLPYEIDPGEGVFYGPKIDVKLRDALGHTWQGPTIQVDFNLPARFDVNYIGQDGNEHQIVMIHRTVLGSMERFLACLIEHYGGAFPLWLAPVQAVVIPITDRHAGYAEKIKVALQEAGISTRVDTRSERMNLKIREAQLQKIPYMLVVGDREEENSTIAVRKRTGEKQETVTLNDFIKTANTHIKERDNEL
ncbi:MAG: threonine--tRNA ligase [Dehalococcoidia bacterium]|nr:threonine--tRNA ligase [Dehalococcoidia bacterium]